MDWGYVAGYFDGEGNIRFKAAPSRPHYILIGLIWSNTHLPSLEAMHAFIGCGIIGHRKKKAEQYKQGHQLKVERVEDIIRVGEAMLPYLIVKRDEMVAMLAWAKTHRTPHPDTWGFLTKMGIKEVSRLYHEEGLTQRQIARRFGLSSSGVSTFFLRNGIKGRRRGPAEGAYGILVQHGTAKLQAMYESGMTIGEIAEELGVQHKTVYMHFYNKGIRLRATKPIRRLRGQRKTELTPMLHLYEGQPPDDAAPPMPGTLVATVPLTADWLRDAVTQEEYDADMAELPTIDADDLSAPARPRTTRPDRWLDDPAEVDAGTGLYGCTCLQTPCVCHGPKPLRATAL